MPEILPPESTLVPLAELQERAQIVSLPLNTKFRGVTHREAMLFAGAKRWSEFSPFLEYEPAEAASWLAAALDYGWAELPVLQRDSVPVNATVPAVEPAAVATVLARFPGCTTVKVKVAEKGQPLAADLARVAGVRAWFDAQGIADAKIRIDANGGWSVSTALTALTALAPYKLDYAEQPCATVAELSQLRRSLQNAGVNVRIAADESVRKAADPLAVARAGAADLLVVKAAPLGGLRRALEVVMKAGLPVVVSSALDTSIGLGMGAALAAALPAQLLAGACGLGTAALYAADIVAEPLLPVAGEITVSQLAADPQLIADHRASPERERWWRERLAACYAQLGQSSSAIL